MQPVSRKSRARIRALSSNRWIVATLLFVLLPVLVRCETRVIEVLADHDSRYRIQGQGKRYIAVRAGEQIRLRITAKKGESWNRDGSVHGFTLLRAKDRSKVPNWDLLLKPGFQEFVLTAPAEPGEYEVVCTVICSSEHEQMNMRFTVLPNQ